MEFAIVENVQRDDLNPIEEANGYKRLMSFIMTKIKLLNLLVKRTHITNCLRLLSLPIEIIKLIEDKNYHKDMLKY